MPELPEVETVARQLKPQVVGKTVTKVKIVDRGRLSLPGKKVEGCSIVDVKRIAKYISLELSNGYFLLVHLRMTGRLIWHGSNVVPENATKSALVKSEVLGAKHCRVIFTTEKGQLFFSDVRRFGTIDFVKDTKDVVGVGLEPLESEFNYKAFSTMAAKSAQPIKNFLLRQDRIVGLGNIYVCEILFLSGVHPERQMNSLTEDELRSLVKNTKFILKKAINNCGTTFSDFQQTTGEVGNFQTYLSVYGRAGEPCKDCREPIIRNTQAGRGTFFCEVCQD